MRTIQASHTLGGVALRDAVLAQAGVRYFRLEFAYSRAGEMVAEPELRPGEVVLGMHDESPQAVSYTDVAWVIGWAGPGEPPGYDPTDDRPSRWRVS